MKTSPSKRYSWAGYGIAILVAVISFSFSLLAHVSDLLRTLASTPGVFALFVAIWQLWRDEVAFERKLMLQQQQQDYILATASKMAEGIFQKQMEFSEAYVVHMKEGLEKIFRSGPRLEAKKLSEELAAIRTKFSPWISLEVERKLVPLERALYQMAERLQWAINIENNPDLKAELIDQMFEIFRKVFSPPNPTKPEDADVAMMTVLEYLRSLLGVPVLTRLRQRLFDAAISRAEETAKGDVT